MKKNFAIQLNHIQEKELLEDKLALDEIGFTDPIYYGLIPFSDEISGAERFDDYDVVIPYGTVKLIKLWQKGLLPKSTKIFYDEPRFDQRSYKDALGRLLLNHRAVYSTLGEVKDIPVQTHTFIKPTRDLKAFAGIVVDRGRTPGEEIFSRPQSSDLSDDEPILMAPLRNVVREYRNFVVGGKLIDSAVYKINDRVTYEVPTTEERRCIDDFFKEVQSRYEPLDTYVVDFAKMVSGDMTVIEYNCFNCAGMYCVDRRKIFKAVIDHAEQLTLHGI